MGSYQIDSLINDNQTIRRRGRQVEVEVDVAQWSAEQWRGDKWIISGGGAVPLIRKFRGSTGT